MSVYDKCLASELPELTAEEKASPYSEFYKRDIGDLPADVIAAFAPGNEMDPAKAVMPEDMWEYLQPGGPVPEMGYCKLPNGAAYTCLKCDVPGMTQEMFNFRTRLVFADHMGFMIEFPGKHLGHWDGLCTEDFGVGYMHGFILDRNYSCMELGYPTHPTLVNPEITEFVVKEAHEVSLEGPIEPEKGWNMLCFVTRKTETGLHCWAFVYTGMVFADGKSTVKLAPGEEAKVEVARQRGIHLAYEYVGRKELCDKYFAEWGDKALAPAKPWPDRFVPFRHS